MDAFEAKYWSKLQILLWICIRHKDAVRWAAHEPGCSRLLDLNLGPDRLDIEPPDDLESRMLPEPGDPPCFDSEQELICRATANLGSIMSFDDAERELIKAQADSDLSLYTVPSGRQFSDSATVLTRWHAAAAAPIQTSADEARARRWFQAEVDRGEKRRTGKKRWNGPEYRGEMVRRFGISERGARKVWDAMAPPGWKMAGKPSSR